MIITLPPLLCLQRTRFRGFGASENVLMLLSSVLHEQSQTLRGHSKKLDKNFSCSRVLVTPTYENRDCQMVYFQTKNPNLGKFRT
jgi:hypothetical protein